MTVKDYQVIVGKTAVFPEEVRDFGWAYLMMGLVDELSELIAVVDIRRPFKIFQEMGDVFWYTTAIMQRLGLDPEEYTPRVEIVECDETIDWDYMEKTARTALCITAEYVCYVKKYYRDDAREGIEYLEGMFEPLIANLFAIYRTLGFATEEILKYNYDKLASRLERNKLHGHGDDR